MNDRLVHKISHYINSHSRNRIVFHKNEIPDTVPANVGLLLSESIYTFKETGNMAIRTSIELNNILNSSINQHKVFGRYLSIQNLGILFEPELKLDFSRVLDSYSQNNLLFVNWNGEIDSDYLYFLTKEFGVKTNIKNLSHIVI